MNTTQQLLQYIEEKIAGLQYPAEPAGLYAPIRYAMQAGGKRLRPMLTLAACEACGHDAAKAINQALGIEMYHNFTLLHDDVMDRAEMRRGRPTVHVKWNEATAILSGDAMLTLASQLMMTEAGDHTAEVMALFNRTAIEVYEGQQMDMDFEPRYDVTVDEYMEMIRLKTSVLLACACRLGAIMAGATDDIQTRIYDFAINLGLAFQLQDDYLDSFGDPAVFGKAIGGDILNDKKTWLLISALNQDSTGELRNLLGPTADPETKIARITDIYRRLNLPEQCHTLINSYAGKASAILNSLMLPDDSRKLFQGIVDSSSTRTH
ncbi:MAG: polyprenyl synthetase family protein [Muribaculaceae bacterium]|nr:polyprenyl synthetase family protein [Muribaculaceae bacterium]